ncbi:hypothetical protein [Paraglaciecola sp.]|uniref:hypothetical protein n=1 Tax=Paraglaciecola sp. TaxID=1920173 RepID=UPI003EF841A4
MKTSKNKKSSWLLPLHIQNLASLMQLGLIVDATGMPLPGSSIFDDGLKDCTGTLCLYRNTVPIAALDSIDKNAKFCILAIELERIKSASVTYKPDGNAATIDLSDIIDASSETSNFEQIMLQGPLPFSIVSEIFFEKKEHKDSFSKIIDSSSLPILAAAKISVKSSVFEKTATLQMNSETYERQYTGYNDDKYDPVYAFGGVLAHLFYLAKSSKEYTDFFDAFEKLQQPPQELDANSSSINTSSKAGEKSLNAFYETFTGKQSKISFILDELISENRINNIDSRSTIIQFLQQHEEPTNQKVAESLLSKKDRGNFIDGFNLEHFRKSNALYFLFKLICDDNLSGILDPIDETDQYRVLFNAMAFGLKFKFENISEEILKYEGLSIFISHSMANYYHKRFNTGTEFTPIKRPKTLFELCFSAGLTNIDRVAKLLDISDCFETKISTNSYEIKNGYPFFKGVLIPKFVMNQQAFFDTMVSKGINAATYNKIKALK